MSGHSQVNKYEEEEMLLKKYENECKYGHDYDQKRRVEIEIRSEKAQNLIKNLQTSRRSTSPTVQEQTTGQARQEADRQDSLAQSLLSDSSQIILSDVLDKLQTKRIKESASASTSTMTSLQFNNYASPVDALAKFGLKTEWTNYVDDAQAIAAAAAIATGGSATGSSSSSSSVTSSSGKCLFPSFHPLLPSDFSSFYLFK